MSNTNNVRLGPCHVMFAGVDLGYTQGGVEFEVKTETHPVYVDQFGKSMINELIIGRTVSVKVPLAETTLDNLVRIMPGATLNATGGTLASGTVTFSVVSVAGDSITINGVPFTCVTANPTMNQFIIGTTVTDQALKFAAAVNGTDDVNVGVTAVPAVGVVTLTAENYDSAFYSYNSVTLAKTGTSPAVSGATLSGGVVATKEIVSVPSGVGVSLLASAQVLLLHPIANADTNRTEDITIPLAATAGAMKFAYQIDKERVFDISFMGYPNSVSGLLYTVGG